MKKICTRFFIILILAFLSVNSLGAVMPTKPVDTSTEVYLGGRPLGIEIGADGLIVTGISKVETANGAEFPMKDSGVRSGDVLTKIAGKSVVKPEDISTIVNKLPSTDVILTFLRDGKPFEVRAKFVVDKNGERRFGVNVRDKITGIGTLTYVTTNGKFGALGHHIADSETGIISALTSGSIFDAYIDGVKKSMPDKAGELIGSFSRSDPVGRIKKNNEFGIFGEYTKAENNFQKIKTANIDEIKPGKAYVYTTISGLKPEYYEIDIVKAERQSKPDVKSMVISITDKRLLNKTGGIVQGMSGSPIIQNGKLVGAVTHVYVGEPTMGFGVFIGWMLQN